MHRDPLVSPLHHNRQSATNSAHHAQNHQSRRPSMILVLSKPPSKPAKTSLPPTNIVNVNTDAELTNKSGTTSSLTVVCKLPALPRPPKSVWDCHKRRIYKWIGQFAETKLAIEGNFESFGFAGARKTNRKKHDGTKSPQQ
ncbi:Protein of unknown function [Pyronema omphalodes CBS 100304]|uniref:Uncharacterized protein n=1 Tax=Pyronema omphalodes (strain CBS 100304) TaxID=1076935 RepID=U4KTU4_PYROM|nr:Protein of unknown function [Pyronema omphalodes CBS 100304]